MLQTTDGPLDAADWLVQQGLSVFLRKDGAGPVLIENQSSQHVMLQGGWNIWHRVAVGATTYSALLTPRTAGASCGVRAVFPFDCRVIQQGGAPAFHCPDRQQYSVVAQSPPADSVARVYAGRAWIMSTNPASAGHVSPYPRRRAISAGKINMMSAADNLSRT